MKENEIIKLLKNFLPSNTSSSNVVVDIGDDTAVINWDGSLLLFTCDTLVEGTHFHRKYFSLYNLGWKSMAVSISDIYAMGGEPEFALVSLGLPEGEENNILEIYKGIKDFASEFHVKVVGGNLSSSPFLWTEVTALGKVDKPITRGGAKEGDLIVVTGYPGEAQAGRRLLEEGKNGYEELKRKFLKPHPRKEILDIKKKIPLNSLIDISDGVGVDLERLIKSSGRGAYLKEEDFPISSSLKSLFGRESFDYFWGGGEDYELLFTVPEKVKVPSSIKGIDLRVIGKIISDEGKIITSKGKIQVKGFDHFEH